MLDNWNNALYQLLINEGGYCNIKGDRGGETYKGISRKFWKNWEGWNTIDKVKALNKTTKKINLECAEDFKLQDLVTTFYYTNFWLKVAGNKLFTPLDFIMFDLGVNIGITPAIKILQKTLKVGADGIIGNVTLNKINNIKDTNIFFKKLKENVLEYYKSLEQPQFIEGWTNRVNTNFKGVS